MRQISLLLLIISFATICPAQNALKAFGLKGKVKQLTDSIFYLPVDHASPEEVQLLRISVVLYNEDGNAFHYFVKDSLGTTILDSYQEYRDGKMIVSDITDNQSGVLIRKRQTFISCIDTLEYWFREKDEDGQIFADTLFIGISDGGKLRTTRIKHAGVFYPIELERFNANGNLIELGVLENLAGYKLQILDEYDSNGFPIKNSMFVLYDDSFGALPEAQVTTYKYPLVDGLGNWKVQVGYDKGGGISKFVKRTLLYY